MVDPEVDGRHLVPRWAAPARPLDQSWAPAPQRVFGVEEGTTVGEGGGELGVEPPRNVQGVEVLPHGLRHVELVWTSRQGGGQVS